MTQSQKILGTILPTIGFASLANTCCEYSGIDSVEHCLNLDYFLSWPTPVVYQFNSRGFRDQDWPKDLKSAVWCIGDSFTVGMGLDQGQSWPAQLGTRAINISLDGASNSWIARQACTILNEVDPSTMIIHWSYSHRRERPLEELLLPIWQEYYAAVRGENWPNCADYRDIDKLPVNVFEDLQRDPRFHCWAEGFDLDLQRKLHYGPSTVEQDQKLTQDCLDQVDACDCSTKIIHSFIPSWHPTPVVMHSVNAVVGPLPVVDLARDGHHYGPQTTSNLVSVFRGKLEI